MTTPELDAVVLPALPEWMLDDGITTLADFELRDHMGSYATAAVLADRERRADAECQRWIAKAGKAYTDAHAIFNDPPSETPQEVRDVIEWHLHAMRHNEIECWAAPVGVAAPSDGAMRGDE